VSLTRADGTDVWTTDQYFQLTLNPQELCFELRVEVSNQEPAVSTLPVPQYSIKHRDGINRADKQQSHESGWGRTRRSARNR
jgi:hypothetical protein